MLIRKGQLEALRSRAVADENQQIDADLRKKLENLGFGTERLSDAAVRRAVDKAREAGLRGRVQVQMYAELLLVHGDDFEETQPWHERRILRSSYHRAQDYLLVLYNSWTSMSPGGQRLKR